MILLAPGSHFANPSHSIYGYGLTAPAIRT